MHVEIIFVQEILRGDLKVGDGGGWVGDGGGG